MESSEQYITPKKPLINQQSFLRFFNSSSGKPVNISFTSKSHNNSLSRKINFSVLPANKTTPTKSTRKVFNPFEAALTDRLHLPIIGSPSLFQRPSTPQYSATQFEWTIDDVSSLGPANVEPHETQFNGSPDPDIEAKAQAAISSFFKEHKVVPSPLVDGQLGSQRIILTELSSKTSIMKTAKSTCDGVAQTILTLPPILPPDIETALKPFFSYVENQQQNPTKLNSSILSIDHEARDASLRRKLFDNHYYTDDTVSSEEICTIGDMSPPPQSPEIDTHSLNNSINKSSFGSLSPISKLETPPKCKKNLISHGFIDVSVTISPISRTNQKEQHIIVKSNSYRTNEIKDISIELDSFKGNESKKSLLTSFSAHRSSSPSIGETSIDSNLNWRVKQLEMNSSKRLQTKSTIDTDILSEDEMQISQGSTRSSLSSDSFTLNFTPRSKKRAANRKNLSQSFSFNLSDTDENQLSGNSKIILNSLDDLLLPLAKKPFIFISENSCTQTNNCELNEKSTFHRTDSGFNEISNTQDDIRFNNKQNIDNNLKTSNFVNKFDTSMNDENIEIIPFCSTPSKNSIQ